MKSRVWKRNRGKILIAIAALLIALAAAYGSGAFFTATATNGPNVFAAGTLSLNPAGVSLNLGPMYPGHTYSGTMTITNGNPVACELYLSQGLLTDPDGLDADVDVTITGPNGTVYGPGPLSGYGAAKLVATLAASGQPGDSATLTWDAAFEETGVNQDALQGAQMSCDYTWTIQPL